MHLKSVQLLPEKFPTKEFYPFNLPVFQQMKAIDFNTPVTLFVGENSTGKSTMLEAICRKCGIHIWQNEQIGRVQKNPYEKMLHEFLEIKWVDGPVPGSFFASDLFKDFTRFLEEWAISDPGLLKYFGGKSLITQSHGQSLMSFFKSRYKIEGLYLLDEPETALSPKTQIELLNILKEMGEAGHAQFIIATHSPILLACPGANILSFDHVPLKQISYEETGHYRIYKDFMGDRSTFLQ